MTIDDEILHGIQDEESYRQLEKAIIAKKVNGLKLTTIEKHVDSFCLPFEALVRNQYIDEYFTRMYFRHDIDKYTHHDICLYQVIIEEWEKTINITNHTDQILKKVSEETRKEFKAANSYSHKSSILEASKYKYITIRKIADFRLPQGVYSFNCFGFLIQITLQNVIHIIFQHYGASVKHYDVIKDHFTKDFWHENLPMQIENILKKIEATGVVQTLNNTLNFKYNGSVYRLCFGSVKNNSNKLITSFFPINNTNIAKLLSTHNEHTVDNSVTVFI